MAANQVPVFYLVPGFPFHMELCMQETTLWLILSIIILFIME